MRTERFFAFIEKYLAGGLLLLLIGLIHSDHGMRGFPFAWLGPCTSVFWFFMSLMVLTLVVIAADVIARVITAAAEPKMQVLTRTQIKEAKAAPAKTSVKPLGKNHIPQHRPGSFPASGAGSFRERETSRSAAERRESAAKIPHISEASVREFGKGLAKNASKALKTTQKDESSKAIGIFITIIAAVISLAATFAALDTDDGFDSDSIIADDEYEEYSDYDSYDAVCQNYLDSLLNSDEFTAEDMLPGSLSLADAVSSDGNFDYYQCASLNTDDGGCVCRYDVTTDQSRYIIAILMDGDTNIRGAALCDFGDHDAFESFGSSSLGDGSLSDEEADVLIRYIEKFAVTAGETEADGKPILLY